MLWSMTDEIIRAANASFLRNASESGTAQEDVDMAQRTHRKFVKLLRGGDITAAKALWNRHILEFNDMTRISSPTARLIDLLD